MFEEVFKGRPELKQRILIAISKREYTSAKWKDIKDRQTWYAAVAESCQKFREVLDDEHVFLQNLSSKFVYDINWKNIPEVIEYGYAALDYYVEPDEETEEGDEIVGDIVEAEFIYKFTLQGDLKKITMEESIAGETFEIWPDPDDFTAEYISIDYEQAQAENLL